MDFTLKTGEATAAQCAKGFSCDAALKNSDFSLKDLEREGFSFAADAFNDPSYKAIVESYAKDAGLSLGDANIDALGQFFMVFNEQTINCLYRGRTAQAAFGSTNMGDWTTERVVYKTRELTGGVGLYDDWSRPALAGYNYGWDYRDTIRFEFGLEVTKLEEAVASVMRRNAYADKKDSIVLQDAIWLNSFFWNGYNVGTDASDNWLKKLYGVLNEPNLASRSSDTGFDLSKSTVTVEKVISVFKMFKQNMIDDLAGNGDINSLPVKIRFPNKWQTALTVANTYNGYTANEWLAKNWSNAEVTFHPELDTAGAGGDPMCFVFAETVPDVGMKSINLTTTCKLRLVGAMPSLKGREEVYSSSMAGAFVACPLAVRKYEQGDESD